MAASAAGMREAMLRRLKKPHMKPKGAHGLRMVKLLGRTYKTGTFDKIAASAGARYKSAAAGKRVAGAVFWNKAKAAGNA